MLSTTIAFVNALPALGPTQVGKYIGLHVMGLPRSVEQACAIAAAAVRQHALRSPCADAEVVGGGVPRVADGSDDLDFDRVRLERVPGGEDLLCGWPVNVAYYAGSVWLHMRYAGLTLSARTSNDYLARFYVPRVGDRRPDGQGKWTMDDVAARVRSVYLMMRNLLAAGLPPSYLLGTFEKYARAQVSPFAVLQAQSALPIGAATMVASDEHVRRAKTSGHFLRLGPAEQAKAQALHRALVAHERGEAGGEQGRGSEEGGQGAVHGLPSTDLPRLSLLMACC